jgi:hypothetical protein
MSIVSMRRLAVTALIVAAAAFGGPAARAQAIPQGSYQRSCEQIHWSGTTLVAECRRVDGRKNGTGLANANRCVGDIGNNNGQLQCTYAGGGQSPGSSPVQRGEPAQGGPGYGGPGPGYGGPGYGGPGPGYDDRRVRCERLWSEQRDLRDRLQYTGWGPDRERLEYRLRQVREDRERIGCGG